MNEPPSSPPSEATSVEDALSWYKTQYEQLESHLTELRVSSKELEEELEKDVLRAEKQERALTAKVETLSYEVEEWKRKYKESKVEASSAQASLEKEITQLRETTRSLQLTLRDIEVANDDFERQARNTSSSLEDMESKYNQAIERGVMMEEEIKAGEQEREMLRIESQRLREELSDLKIEAEVFQDKMKKQEARHLSTLSTDFSVPESPTFDKSIEESVDSAASSPLVTTPPDTKPPSTAATVSEVHDPPSPPMSDASAPLSKVSDLSSRTRSARTGATRKARLPSLDATSTPTLKAQQTPRTGTRPRLSSNNVPLRTPVNRPNIGRSACHKLPASNSLSHIRTLTAQMQRLEARVQSARSKLPAPTNTPPRVSPRSSLNGGTYFPSSVTIRSRKRNVGSTASSVTGDDLTPTPQSSKGGHVPRLSHSAVNRLSYGPLPNRGPESDASRPCSRASMSSYARPSSRADMAAPPRPQSRSSYSGSRTPIGRPRSSMSGSLHGYSRSIGGYNFEEEDEDDYLGHTPSRRGTFSKFDNGSSSGIPLPGSSIPVPGNRRLSAGRKLSSSIVKDSSRLSTSSRVQRLEDLGETY